MLTMQVNSRVVWAAAVALIFVGGAAYLTYVDENGSSEKEGDAAKERVEVQERGAPSLGKSDARVTIVEFADFQCPSCGLFHFGAGAVIIEEYVKTGKARFVFKQFPLLGEESFWAAYAAQCAKEQGKFWEYHDLLFARQSQSEGENTGTFSALSLLEIAREAGAHEEAFSSCLRSEKYRDAVLEDVEDGKRAGVEGTPTVFVNGRKMEGIFPFEAYRQIIEEELKGFVQ